VGQNLSTREGKFKVMSRERPFLSHSYLEICFLLLGDSGAEELFSIPIDFLACATSFLSFSTSDSNSIVSSTTFKSSELLFL